MNDPFEIIETDLRVRYAETDAMGIVYHANYFIWFGWPHRPDFHKAAKAKQPYDSPHSYVTIDGASAPAPGITFANGGFYIGYGMHDIIIRHIRIKHGTVGGSGGDGICLRAKRVLIDHCTITEAVDETIDCHEGAENVTVQNCILGPASRTGHPKGEHSAGPFVAYGATRVTLHHNLIAKNYMRNPLLYGDRKKTYEHEERPLADVRNNLNFGCHQGAIVGAGMRANLIGNFYLNQRAPAIYIVAKYPVKPQLYIKDNASFPDRRNASGNLYRIGKGEVPAGHQLIVSRPFDAAPVTTQPALDAARLVLATAGARPWARGPIEAPLIAEVRAAAAALFEKGKATQPEK